MNRVLLFALAMLSGGTPVRSVLAQTAATDTSGVDPCPRAITQFALTACADTIARKADAALTIEYQKVMATLSPARRRLLRDAERRWIAYRAAECRYVASEYEGGSMYPMQQLFCLAAMTNARRDELHQQAVDEQK